MLDVDAFAARLTESYQRLWLIAAAITGDRTEADDIVQEAALVALRKRIEFTVGTNFTAWMSQIVRLTALNHVRKTNRQGTHLTDPLTLDRSQSHGTTNTPSTTSAVSPDGQLAQLQREFDDEVFGALQGVNDLARACLLLRSVQHLSYQEIAEVLQIPAGTAMSHVHRARQQLRERLKSHQSAPATSSDTRTPS